MALTETGSNLNIWGDSGQFETDPSTWLFTLSSGASIFRDTVKTKGNYGYKTVYDTFLPPDPNTIIPLCKAKFTAEAGKSYIIKARMRTTLANPIGSDTAKVFFEVGGVDISGGIGVPVVDNKENFLQLYIEKTDFTAGDKVINLSLDKDIQQNGVFYVDEFEIFEAIEEEPIEVTCDIFFDLGGTVINDLSAPGANDGYIEVAVSGNPQSSLEYSKDDGVTWQASNQFAGLAEGTYPIKVRETVNTSCEISRLIAINELPPDFDFTASTVNESYQGAQNGEIAITVTGNTAPFTYSKDGGVSYQTSNLFTGLSAGTYDVSVKDVDGYIVTKPVTITAVALDFDKIFFSENMIPYERTATANKSEENYKIYVKIDTAVKVVGTENLTFSNAMNQILKPNSNDKAIFNLRPAVRNAFPAKPPQKLEGLSRIYDRSVFVRKSYGDIFNDMTEPASFNSSLADLVIYGGLDKLNYPNINYFKGYLPNEKKFLTWRPKLNYVDRNQEDYLSFFVYSLSINQLKVKAKAYYDDNTEQTDTINSTSGSQLLYGRIYQIPAGPFHSNAGAINPSKNMIKYDIWIEDQNNEVISDVLNFQITTFKTSLTRYILFLNSVGGYDVVRLTGKTAQSTEVEKQKVMKYLDFDYVASDGEEKSTYAKNSKRLEYSSGMFKGKYSEYMAEYMQDLISSKKVFDITNGERIPINIDGGTFRIKESADYKYYTRFEANLSYTDNLFTPSSLPKLGE